jgi:hypothetical protein
MIRTISRNLLLLTGLSLGVVTTNCQADFTGSFGVVSFSPTINSNSLANATVFNIEALEANGNTTGGFSGIGLTGGTPFTGGSFTLGNATQLSFSNSTYGTFTETVAPSLISQGYVGGVLTSEAFSIVGTYMGGPVGNPPVAASFTVSFTQDGGPNNSVSASGTLTIPAGVPEPASIAMVGLGVLAAIGGFGLRLKKAKLRSAS